MMVNLKNTFTLLFILSMGIYPTALGQNTGQGKVESKTEENRINLKTIENEAAEANKGQPVIENPDTNFTFEKYADFLVKVSDTSKYVVLPINEFRKKNAPDKIVIGLRHDVDNDLNVAKKFSATEKMMGFRSTYYILHTADYYLSNPSNKEIHNESIIPVLKEMQDNSGFEIGWHNDLVTLQVVYNIDPVDFLHKELDWLRTNGLKVTGTASHGSNYCKNYWYLNFYFFEECTWPVVGQYVNNVTVPTPSGTITLKKGKFGDFGLDYEAYFLNNNKYFSDASFTNGNRWHIGLLDLNSLVKGDRVIILLHPIHWHQASTLADFRSFKVDGQKSCTINGEEGTITVYLPEGSDRKAVMPVFTLSPGAYAKVSGTMQTSGISVHDFTNPVKYTVFAENRSITKEWTVKIENAKSSANEILSFTIPGFTRKVIIDQAKRSVVLRLISTANVVSLPVQFRLSDGATAWINGIQQFPNSGTVDFSQPVTYKIIAEDGVASSLWNIKVEILNNKADILSFVVPGMARPAEINTVNKEVYFELKAGEPLNDLPVLFQLSENAKAYLNDILQISGLSVASFTQPVIYKIISEDSLTLNNWKASASNTTMAPETVSAEEPLLRIYPNPVYDNVIIDIRGVREQELRIEIYNNLGKRVYSSVVRNSGSYSEEIDLSGYSPGIYHVKCSAVNKPVTFIVARR
jgi:hypothetical protein